MRCPYCGGDRDRVIDSRPAEDGEAIRRRRECRICNQRFSTFERAEHTPLTVRKRNGTAEPFTRDKLLAGMRRAIKNLDLTEDDIRRSAAQVEARLRAGARREVASKLVGTEVLAALRDLDHVAYVRFASVYKGFTSPEDFRRELATLEKEQPPKRPDHGDDQLQHEGTN